MVAREGERDAPRAPAPPSADASAAGSSGTHAPGWAPAFAGVRAPWERPPGAPENTRWRAWGGRGRDRPRPDAGWSRKDRRAQRKHARDDRRYFDYDRTDAPPGPAAAPAFVPPYERDAAFVPPYGAPEDAVPQATRPHLPYGDTESQERKPRMRSRWDVGPADAPGPPPPPPAPRAAVKQEEAEAMDIETAAPRGVERAPTERAPTERAPTERAAPAAPAERAEPAEERPAPSAEPTEAKRPEAPVRADAPPTPQEDAREAGADDAENSQAPPTPPTALESDEAMPVAEDAEDGKAPPPESDEAMPAAEEGAPAEAPAPPVSLGRSLRPVGMLDEEMMERAILATERTLHAVERAADAVQTPPEVRAPPTPTTPVASAATAPDAPRPVEQARAAAKEPEDVEATAQTVLAVAKQLVAAHPLTDAHVARLLEANRRTARSLTAPAVLAFTREAAEAPAAAPAVLERDARERHAARQAKTAALRAEYRRLHTAWVAYCAHLDRVYERREQQRRAPTAGAHDDDGASAPAALATPLPSRTRRGAGGFGDAVRSEAEFLEILASLESAEMQDPVARAARTAASVPDMDVRVVGDPALVDGDNGFVADFGRFYFSSFDPDVWSAEERATFTKRYALYPKQFGRIARGLPHKTMQQCVVYYYLHKHLPGYDFKALSTKSRERKRKARRPKKAKGSALMADIAAGSGKEPDADDAEEAKPRTEDDRPGKAAKRPRPPKKASPPGADDAPVDAQADAERARDLAAAEALEALAGLAPPAPKKKAPRRPKRDEDGEPRSRSRGPHWSMTERAEFLRLLALHGKDWAALATAFPAKTAAQTRNFFARHASESSHFQAAAALALENAARPYAERSAAAVAFVNEWYASLPEDVQASVEGWPADPASFAEAPVAPPARDDDETDEEAAEPAAPAPAAPAPAAYAARLGSGPPAPEPGPAPGLAAPGPAPAPAAPVARAAPEAWGYAYVPPSRPMAYREGYERYAMYAYPDRYRHEYAAPYRDERAYAPAYAPDGRYAERRADVPPEARAEYAPGRPDAYADGVPPVRRFLPPGPSLGYFPPRAERGWRGA
ncbi:DNA-binding protein snt1 [Malassezia brasiliensis]|uniref:DNA-binding protein snt1 n=1 Tax=Malassezia brasiliensis TaxID=1821822 RepID=A0AAF0DRE3_9BASI|nr:DNA-binding protein snt1 [Malassezia brasiliensis]